MSEHFVSGYCRQLDGARMVELEIEGGAVSDVDCQYGDCPFQPACKIAEAIDELLEK